MKGGQGCFILARGGLIFSTINRGGHEILRFCKGSCLCFCKWDYFYEIN